MLLNSLSQRNLCGDIPVDDDGWMLVFWFHPFSQRIFFDYFCLVHRVKCLHEARVCGVFCFCLCTGVFVFMRKKEGVRQWLNHVEL